MNIGIISGGSADIGFIFEYISRHGYGYWIGVDSGLEAMKRLGIVPDCAVGDFDSCDPEVVRYYRGIHMVQWEQYPEEKDLTDFEAAVRLALAKSPESITVFGGTGTRLDHTWSSLSMCQLALEAGVRMEFVDPWQRIYMLGPGTHVLRRSGLFGGYISFIHTCGPVRGLSLQGFKYPLAPTDLDGPVSLTVSNEPASDLMRVSLEEGAVYVVEAKDEPADESRGKAR